MIELLFYDASFTPYHCIINCNLDNQNMRCDFSTNEPKTVCLFVVMYFVLCEAMFPLLMYRTDPEYM